MRPADPHSLPPLAHTACPPLTGHFWPWALPHKNCWCPQLEPIRPHCVLSVMKCHGWLRPADPHSLPPLAHTACPPLTGHFWPWALPHKNCWCPQLEPIRPHCVLSVMKCHGWLNCSESFMQFHDFVRGRESMGRDV